MMPVPTTHAGRSSPPTYILDADARHGVEDVGRKAHTLARARAAGFPIPDWFVLAPPAFEASLTDAERVSLAAVSRAGARFSPLQNFRLATDVHAQLAGALQQLCPEGQRVAVRSSASDEDDVQRSFAGQFATHLDVACADVPACIADVWRSAFSEPVLAYRRAHDLPFPARAPAVLVQRQLRPEAAGVAFGADPVTGRRAVAVVAAVRGLGSALVSGERDGDTFHVSRDGRILSRAIASTPAIDDDRVREIAELARRAGRHFGAPQDIEWAIEDGRVYLLQSRPITALKDMADPDAALNIWDNSNVAESYPGITSPLTFSFIRYVYEEVYREFCRLVGVPPRVIAEHDDTFGRMLGLMRGRVYYNLLSWYRLLATLPGFTLNRRFMEQMMGVAEGIPEAARERRRPVTTADKLLDGVRLARTSAGLAWSGVRLTASTRRFRARLAAALDSADASFTDARPDQIVAHYRSLERQLLKRWDAPLVNDFFAMIFYGVLRGLCKKWCADGERTLQNDLLSGAGGVVSTEPARRVREMAQIASASPALVQALCAGSRDEIDGGSEHSPDFRARFAEYLQLFGDRCFEELKLESPTLTDDPLPALRTIGQLANAFARTAGGDAAGRTTGVRMAAHRAAAESRVRTALEGQPLRRLVFNWVLRQARLRVRERENLRFERTRLFGRVRRIFRALGRELVALGALSHADDIFFLHLDEVLGFVEGTSVSTDLKGLAVLRRAEYERCLREPAPDDRFETRGVVHAGNAFRGRVLAAAPAPHSDTRRGIGCCPGLVEGRVSLVRDPRRASIGGGAILVAERTDPAWVVLFATSAGLLVERGSVLSHSAIIAREMGVPAIVSIPGLTTWLRDGDLVRMDGSTGIVSRMTAEESGHAG